LIDPESGLRLAWFNPGNGGLIDVAKVKPKPERPE
jgi:hypothetical protein